MPQILHLRHHTEGITVTLYWFNLAFMAINLSLAWKAYQLKREWNRLQGPIIYTVWIVLFGLHLIVLRNVAWREHDTIFVLAALTVVAATSATSRAMYGLSYSDPLVRGWINGLCRFLPHGYLALCILQDGDGRGLASTTIWMGHISIFTRLAHVWLTAKKTGFDRNLKGIVVAEAQSEVSWVIVTIVWVLN